MNTRNDREIERKFFDQTLAAGTEARAALSDLAGLSRQEATPETRLLKAVEFERSGPRPDRFR